MNDVRCTSIAQNVHTLSWKTHLCGMKKRTFIKLAGTAGAGLVIAPFVGCGNSEPSSEGAWEGKKPRPFLFEQEPLGFDFSALEPIIDARTMEIHYTKHHAGYVNKLNKAIRGAEGRYDGLALIELLTNLGEGDTALRNNGGGHFNHTLYWRTMQPGGPTQPEGKLKSELEKTFGSTEDFMAAFSTAASNRFGSGWAWLIRNSAGDLEITSTPNQDNPLMSNLVEQPGMPLLGIDVWEHAYYLNYQNRRSDYIQGFLSLVNWDVVAAQFAQSAESKS